MSFRSEPAVDESWKSELIPFDTLDFIHILIETVSSSQISKLNACLNQAGVDYQARLHAQFGHIINNLESMIKVSSFPINFD